MRFANIREMHQPSAVGIAKEAAIDDKGLYLGAKIVDDEAWQKVVEGVYKGFSIGGCVTARDARDPTVITGHRLAEITLVDRPANPEATVELFKVAMAEGLHKVGARHSKEDLSRVQGIHDMAAALGADCPGAHADDGEDEPDEDDKHAMAKLHRARRKVAELETANSVLARRVAELERRPEPGKAVLRTVDKSADYPSRAPTETSRHALAHPPRLRERAPDPFHRIEATYLDLPFAPPPSGVFYCQAKETGMTTTTDTLELIKIAQQNPISGKELARQILHPGDRPGLYRFGAQRQDALSRDHAAPEPDPASARPRRHRHHLEGDHRHQHHGALAGRLGGPARRRHRHRDAELHRRLQGLRPRGQRDLRGGLRLAQGFDNLRLRATEGLLRP